MLVFDDLALQFDAVADFTVAAAGERTTWNAWRPDGRSLGKHDSYDNAQRACIEYARKSGLLGRYKILPPNRFELTIMGFRVEDIPPPGDPGQLWVAQSAYTGVETTQVQVQVRRGGSGAAGACAVDWAVTGFSEGTPVPASGSLTWADGEQGVKTVTLQLGQVTADRAGFFTLSNPRTLTPNGRHPALAASQAALTIQNDTTPPSVPAGLAASNVTQTGCTLSCNPASATGAAVVGYRFYRNNVQLPQQANPTISVTGLTAGTTYSFQVSAVDAVGNESARSTAIQVTTQSAANAPPNWNAAPATLDLEVGVPVDINVGAWAQDPDGDPLAITKLSGDVPGLTYNPTTKRLTGTPTTVNTTGTDMVFEADDGFGGGGSVPSDVESDWQARTSGPHIRRAIRFDSLAAVTAGIHSGSQFISWDQATKLLSGGSLRYSVPSSAGEDAGNWRAYVRQDQSNVIPPFDIYIQWCQRWTASALTAFPGTRNGFAGGFKQLNFAEFNHSNILGEVVMENSNQRGAPSIYYRDNIGNYVSIQDPMNTPGGSPDFRWQNRIDNGGPLVTLADYWRRYGPFDSMPANTGTPHPDNGGLVYVPDEWMVFMMRVRCLAYNQANSIIQGWGSRYGHAPREFIRRTNAIIGRDGTWRHNAIWPIPYNTQRTSGGGVSYSTWYDAIITAEGAPIAWPGGFNVTPA